MGGIALDLSITASSGAVGASIEVLGGDGPIGRPGVRLMIDPHASTPVDLHLVRRGGGGRLPVSVEVFPTLDLSGLTTLATTVVPAEILRIALSAARDEEPLLGPFLDALGLGPVTGPVRLPAGLLADPVAWLLDDTVLGGTDGRPDPDRLRALLTGIAGFLPGTHPSGGVTLPWGLELTVSAAGGDVRLQLAWPTPITAGPVRFSGAVGLAPTAGGGPLRPSVSSTVDFLDPTSGSVLGGLDTSLGSTTDVGVRVGAGPTIALLPTPGNFGALAGAGAAMALRYTLDAVTTIQAGSVQIGQFVGRIGDALGLRTTTFPAGRFDEAALRAFADDPVAGLAGAASGLAAALGDLVDPFLPGTVATVGTVTTIDLIPGPSTPTLTVTVDVGGTTPVVTLTAEGVEPISGLAVGGSVTVGTTLRALSIDVEVTETTLLAAGPVPMLPFASFAIGADTSTPDGRFDTGLWFEPRSAGDRDGLVVVAPVGDSVTVRCRQVRGAGTTDIADPARCALDLMATYLLPLAMHLVLSVDEVKTLLDMSIGGGPTVGSLVARAPADEAEALLVHETGPSRYRLARNLIDPDDLEGLGLRALRTFFHALGRLSIGFEIPGLSPVTVAVASPGSGDDRLGLRITVPDDKELVLLDGEVALTLEVDDTWIYEVDGQPEVPDTGGIELFMFHEVSGRIEVDPLFRIRGLGLRIGGSGNDKLLDSVVTIGAVGLHGLFEIDARPGGRTRGGGQIKLERFALPLGTQGDGSNPIASGLLSGDDSGDAEQLAPAFSPSFGIVGEDSEVTVVFRAGDGDGPWWLPIQRGFGPLYVDQVGIDRTMADTGAGRELVDISFLLDGGASLAGLTVQVDDLSLTIPWQTASRLSTWKVDLAGMAVGYQGGGVTVAGGFSRFPVSGSVEYRGLATVRFSVYGATAIGAYGEFPDGSGGTYPSFFLFAAVNAPIGGPPQFFVTGLGGGMGINRRVLPPASITDVPTYPLVEALDSGSDIASDPMGALQRMGAFFPPERGSLWFAAGLEFTSFALVRSTAVLTVEVGGGLEINLLGISRMTLPSPATPMVQVELALQARFSTREGVFSILAQLTDNSWVINEQCRLTGGFAFVTWFKGSNAGQFVLTLGGYHPRFDKPSAFPDVPRLGFAWEPGGGVVIKGGCYFALTSSAVMAGGQLEVAYRSGIVWARLALGAHFLISWDPFHYDIEVFVEISAGVKFRVCFFVCGTVKLSFSFGVRVHILGPKLRGTATLDLDVITVTVRFGPSGDTNQCRFIDWNAFADKYVLAPPETPGAAATRHVTSASIARGQLASESGSDPDDAPDGSASRPWQVEPEFGFTVQTRAATNVVDVPGTTVPSAIAMQRLDLGPMGAFGVDSTLRVRVRRGTASGADRTGRLDAEVMTGQVPEAMWRIIRCDKAQPSANVLPSVIGVAFDAPATAVGPSIAVEIEKVDEGTVVHPLPLTAEHTASLSRGLYGRLRDAAIGFVGAVTGERITVAAGLLTEGEAHAKEAVVASTLLADRAAPPRIGSLSDGLADRSRSRVVATEVIVEPPTLTVDHTRRPPRLDAVLTLGDGRATDVLGRTSVGAARTARVPAPTVAAVQQGSGAALGARLLATTGEVRGAASTVVAVGTAPGAAAAAPVRERRRRPGLDRGLRSTAATVERALVGSGHPVPPGDVLVVGVDPGQLTGGTDTVHVSRGTPVRVVALDEGDVIVADRTVTDGSVEIPVRATRLVLTPAGAGTDSGWLAATQVVQLSSGAWLTPGAVVRAGAPPTRRRAGVVDAAVVRAADSLGRSRVADTVLAPGTTAVAVVLDGVAEGIPPEFAVRGARTPMRGRRPLGPTVVRTPDHTVMVVPLEPEGEMRPEIRVGVGTDQQLVGVVGTTRSAEELAARVVAGGLAAIDPGPLTARSGASTRVRWEAADRG